MSPDTQHGWSSWPAPAKLNLFLHVTGRRPDGYHEIQTLFQLLDWGDEIHILRTEDARIGRKDADYPVAEEDDLVIRAARLLQRAAGCRSGAMISVRKNIPLGSGLGGGSSDAATVLLVLNQLWHCGFDLPTLAALGLRLGADVPVFVHGHTAMASGIGDQLEPAELGSRHYVLVLPALSISTRAVFCDPDLARNSTPISLAEARAGRGRNDCEAVVRKRYPAMAKALDTLRRWGRPTLTGTGSGIFLSMESREDAMSAAREMKSLYNVRAVSGVDRSPLQAVLEADGPRA
jgi:4-diphosphocytidyl-2-C-methyl-D-erythritol kinase